MVLLNRGGGRGLSVVSSLLPMGDMGRLCSPSSEKESGMSAEHGLGTAGVVDAVVERARNNKSYEERLLIALVQTALLLKVCLAASFLSIKM